jgi:regulator of nucleoside diphosphate kinase
MIRRKVMMAIRDRQLLETDTQKTTMRTTMNERYAVSELKPRITLTAEDHNRLSALASAASARMPDLASALADELDRANIVATGRQPQDVVRMRSDLEFRDDLSGKVQTVTLVYPEEADIAQGKISVLTPVGTALIGLTIGEPITWRTRAGELKRLTVLKVRDPEHA